MAFQHIRSGDLASINFKVGKGLVKVLDIGHNGRYPVALVRITAPIGPWVKGDTFHWDARALVSRTPSKGITIPVWRKEN